MRAAYYSQTGAAKDVLAVATIDTPSPAVREVRVALAVSGINPTDIKNREVPGRNSQFSRVIPHHDGAGIIDKVGDGLDRSLIGRRVWVFNAQFERANGTAAEFVVLPPEQTVRMPDDMDFAVGACLGIPFRTAYCAVDFFGDLRGKWVLVAGGAGAVGHYAIQIAKDRNAKVVTTVSSEEKAFHARSAGADIVVLYPAGGVKEQILDATAGAGVDHVVEVDLTGNAAQLPEIVRSGGTVCVYGSSSREVLIPAHKLRARGLTLNFLHVYRTPTETHSRIVADLARMHKQRRLVHSVAARFPLGDIAEAHEAVASGKIIGKTVLDIC